MRALLSDFHQLNQTFFRGQLRPPAIELSPTQARLGQWRADTRTISLSRGLPLGQPWGVVIEVLKHEMVHQYVHEVLRETTETAHGQAFQAVCQRLGVDPSASGLPADQTQAGHTRIIERVARLLALAESPNRHEAEAAMAAAQKLMLKHNLDAFAPSVDRSYVFRHVGRPTGRVTEAERILSVILSEHFFVEVIWVPVFRPSEGRRGSVLEVCGTPENVEMADYVHSFLSQCAERLWREHKREQQIRADRDRRVYLAGVMTGFLENLNQQTRVHQKAGLVWVKDAVLHGFYRKRHPYIRNTRYAGIRRTDAWDQGKHAGRGIVLHRAVHDGGSGTRVLALPPASKS